MSSYPFPLSVQIALPDGYAGDADAQAQMELIAGLGLTGVEVNFADPDRLDAAELVAFLSDHGLRFTYFASGLTAKTFGLSLSATDEAQRRASVAKTRSIVDRLSVLDGGTGIIIGFLKGGPELDRDARTAAFRRSMEEILPAAEQARVSLCVEATNRYESCVANTLDGTHELLDGLFNGFVEILPDTFHMNIEERDGTAALERHLGAYRSIHLSDNNRFLPGFGAIDFERILRHLRRIGFSGGVALEGNIANSFAADLRAAAEFLGHIGERMESNE